ncbi:MAG: hypothetical protein P4L87_07340 [Formivibrio sp.]|nr:hypothetical protein [Formivibrio sp.]
MKPEDETAVHAGLLVEHEKLLRRLALWRSETTMYRWLNIFFFMSCKIIVPTGALVVAINMISIVMSKPLLSDTTSAVIAIVVTFLASLEAMLNPGAKKRLAFTLNNELSSIEYKLNLAKVSNSNEGLEKTLSWADGELKRLLNNYSENGY